MVDGTVGFVGAGQMARALAQGFVSARLLLGKQVVAHDPIVPVAQQFATGVAGALLAPDNQVVVRQSRVVFLAVKPQTMPAVLAELAGQLSPDKLVISIAAGVNLRTLCDGLQTNRVIRVMPNTPCLVGRGASAYALAAGCTDQDDRLAQQLLSAVGGAWRVDEKLLDAVTGLSGSGPAFVFLMIEALADGGVRMGLPRDLAAALAAHTVRGAAEMALQSGEHPAVLKDRVASPGGTTIAGLAALEQGAVRGALIAAVEAAARRSQELGK